MLPVWIEQSQPKNRKLVGFLRRQHAQFWMNLFQDLKDSDSFSGDFLDKSLIQFTCLEIIEVSAAIVTYNVRIIL